MDSAELIKLQEENNILRERIELLKKNGSKPDDPLHTSAISQYLIDQLPSLIFIKDIEDDYKYVMINEEYCKAKGKKREDVIGKTDFQIYTKEKATKYREEDIKTEPQKENFTVEDIVLPDGKKETIRTSKKIIKIPTGDRLLVCISHYISKDIQKEYELKKAIENEKATLKKAQAVDKLKNLFIANMSHEIRTPLNAIVGFSQLLIETQDKNEKDEFYKIIKYNNDLLISLINNILSLSLIESGTIDIQEEAFDFSITFNSTATNLSTKVDNPQIEFINGNTIKEVIIKSDELKITQIINNLVNNAIKFTNYGFIKMSFKLLDNEIEVVVEDTGIGIKEEDKERIFKRFEKVNPYIQGTGLGLSICKSLAEQLKGSITVDSTFGKGSKFLFRFPCKIISHS